jgi:hypothetical protein
MGTKIPTVAQPQIERGSSNSLASTQVRRFRRALSERFACPGRDELLRYSSTHEASF